MQGLALQALAHEKADITMEIIVFLRLADSRVTSNARAAKTQLRQVV